MQLQYLLIDQRVNRWEFPFASPPPYPTPGSASAVAAVATMSHRYEYFVSQCLLVMPMSYCVQLQLPFALNVRRIYEFIIVADAVPWQGGWSMRPLPLSFFFAMHAGL